MTDATTITACVMAGGAAITSITPIVMTRRKARKEKDETSLASFTALNNALGEQIQRTQEDMTRLRHDYEGQIARLRGDYENRLDTAQKRITELESEVGTLQRLLSRRPDQ